MQNRVIAVLVLVSTVVVWTISTDARATFDPCGDLQNWEEETWGFNETYHLDADTDPPDRGNPWYPGQTYSNRNGWHSDLEDGEVLEHNHPLCPQ